MMKTLFGTMKVVKLGPLRPASIGYKFRTDIRVSDLGGRKKGNERRRTKEGRIPKTGWYEFVETIFHSPSVRRMKPLAQLS